MNDITLILKKNNFVKKNFYKYYNIYNISIILKFGEPDSGPAFQRYDGKEFRSLIE